MELQEGDVPTRMFRTNQVIFASRSARLGISRSLSVRFNLGGLRGKRVLV